MAITPDQIARLDAEDPLRSFREEFLLRDGLIYLDGNSLGAMPKASIARMDATLRQEWAEGLITSWNDADWVISPRRIGDKMAQLIGAFPGEVVAADSTSVNIFKALTAALSLQPDRRILLTEQTNFPTDGYIMQGLAEFAGDRAQCVAVPPEDVLDRLDDDVAVLLLTQTHYKSGLARDMAEVKRRAHEVGALVIWDLSHSAGAIEVDLNGANSDFAVGCGYKYLNGGPGAPAFIFVAKRHQHVQPVLSGWFGHAKPFDFDDEYQAAEGIERFLCGTPPVLGLGALEEGIDLMLRADMGAIRRKSMAMTQLLIDQIEERCGEFGFALASPRDGAVRGSQVSFAHPNGYEMMQALKARDVIGDFRAPDIMRFGVTPLYLRYADIVEAVERLHKICVEREWDRPEYRIRSAVT